MRATNRAGLPHMHGKGEVAVSRYFALYLAQASWIALGAYLLNHAFWPSTCQPETLMDIYGCSARLAEQRGWIESTLMTWLWSTPILIALEILRRIDRFRTA